MISTSIRVALSTIFFAGALAPATTEAAQAQSVMKQCGDEWKAAKVNNTTNGMTWPHFLLQRLTRRRAPPRPPSAAARPPAAAPAPAPAAAPAAPAPAETHQLKPAPTKRPARPLPAAGQFSSEAEAKARCPSNTVVWVNTKGKSHTYHYQGTRWYGTTKQGAKMCEADAGAAGYHASKSRTGQPKQQP